MIPDPVRIGGFFSGIGAHISGCERIAATGRARFRYVFQCEFDRQTVEGHDALHGFATPVPNLGDITGVESIGGDLQVDILYWTPPCQDISNAGQMAGNAKGSGTRSSLAFEVPRILANTPERERPRYLVMEEVPMMVSRKFIGNFNELLGELTALGYRHEWGIINAADCGVAQSRKRVFVISKLEGAPPSLPEPIPLDKCLRDYLEPEPVAPEYYLSEDRLKGLIWSNQKEEEADRGFRYEPTRGEGVAHCITTRGGGRPENGQLPHCVIEMRASTKTYSGRGLVYSVTACAPTLTAHIAKNRDEGLVRARR